MARSGKTKSDVTTLTPTAAYDLAGTSGQDIDSIVQKAVDAAIQSAMSMFENRLRSILDEKLTELSKVCGRFPDSHFPGQTFRGQYVFQAPFYSRWRRARQPFDCQLQTQRSGQQEHNEWRIVNKRSK